MFFWPWLGGSVVGASSLYHKGCVFDSRMGYVWETTDRCLSPSLSPFPASLPVSEHVSRRVLKDVHTLFWLGLSFPSTLLPASVPGFTLLLRPTRVSPPLPSGEQQSLPRAARPRVAGPRRLPVQSPQPCVPVLDETWGEGRSPRGSPLCARCPVSVVWPFSRQHFRCGCPHFIRKDREGCGLRRQLPLSGLARV